MDVRRSRPDGRRLQWDYTLVLKETAGRRVVFEKLEDGGWSGRETTPFRRERPFWERLEPHGELRVPSSNFVTASSQISVFRRFHGKDHTGSPVMVDVRVTFDASMGIEQPLGTLETLEPDVRRSIAEGRYREGITTAREVIRLREQAHGPNHPIVAVSHESLGVLLRDSGEYAAAKSVFERALRIREEALGPEHSAVAITLTDLAGLHRLTGEYAVARALQQRALGISQVALGPEHPAVGRRLSSLAELLRVTGDYAGARSLLERALRIQERTLGPQDPDVARTLHGLGEVFRLTGDQAGALRLHERALEIRERIRGPTHPEIAVSLHALALIRIDRGQYAEAEAFLRRSMTIYEAALGAEHPAVGASIARLAGLLARQGRTKPARSLYERARRIFLVAGRSSADLDDEAQRSLRRAWGWWVGGYIKLLADIAREPGLAPGSAPAWLDAFVVAEQVHGGAAQAALTRAAARAAAEEATTAGLALEIEELRERRQALRRQFAEAQGDPRRERDVRRVSALLREVEEVERNLNAVNERLRTAFPRYGEILSPEPVDVSGVQTLLRPDEALLSFFSLDDRLLIWLVRPGRRPVYRDIAIPQEDLARQVARVRASADQGENPDLPAGQLLPFDVEGAHALYDLLLAPFAGELTGASHLLLVPDDILLPLPFAALVMDTGSPAYEVLARLYAERRRPTPSELAEYGQLAWLTKAYSLSVLPSATSLRALRSAARPAGAATEPFLGFGDPVLEGRGHERGGRAVAWRGVAVVLHALRQMSRLPGTREELLAIASALGAEPETAVYLGDRATKPMLLELDRSGRLGRARVLAFATHALMSGELEGLRQPALVLTPPSEPSEEDDGLLTLEDILRLKLPQTEWVILSACNTAAADGTGEGLAGLARGFFFSGARALVVSHWAVDDRATQSLMAEVFRRYARDPALARVEALRQGMLALMRHTAGDLGYFAHPFAWAPFFLVGDGAAGL